MGTRLELTIAPGVTFPDWSVVNDPQVEAALQALLKEERMRKQWDGLTSVARNIHQHVLHSYLLNGRAPTRKELRVAKQLSEQAVAEVVDDLAERDLVLLTDGEISAAYPFSTATTRHAVEINGRVIPTICAIDALGTGPMFGSSTHVTSSCPVCETDIGIKTEKHGLSTGKITPASAIVWAGVQAIDGCAANTQCQSMLLFCCDSHLQEWKNTHPADQGGFRLLPHQALQAGAAMFIPFMA